MNMTLCTKLRYYDEIHNIWDTRAGFGFVLLGIFVRLSYGQAKGIPC